MPAPPVPADSPQDAPGSSGFGRGSQSVITTTGLSHTSAEHLAQQITELLAEPDEALDKT